MKYVHKITGASFESDCICSGEDWELVKTSNPTSFEKEANQDEELGNEEEEVPEQEEVKETAQKKKPANSKGKQASKKGK